MALSETYNTSYSNIKGVYSQDNLKIYESDTLVSYFIIKLYQNDTLYRIVQLEANSEQSASLDLNKLYQDLFNSDIKSTEKLFIKANHDITSCNINNEIIDNLPKQYDNYLINGINSNYDNYIVNTGNAITLGNYNGAPKFLNNEKTSSIFYDKDLISAIGDYALNKQTLSYIHTTESVSLMDSFVDTLNIKIYNNNKSISTTTYIIPTDINKVNSIVEFGIDPISLGLFDNYTLAQSYKYTLQDITNKSEIFTVNLKHQDKRNGRYFRLFWVNENGVNVSFNFSYNYQKSIKTKSLKYTTLDNNNNEYEKSYNINKDEIYNITTDWLNEDESNILESLWTSPSVKASLLYNNVNDFNKDYLDNKLIEDEYIILDVKNMDIKRRRNTKLINYSINFTIASKYNVQNK